MADGATTGGIAAGKLKSFVERIERLDVEKANIASDIKDIYSEAAGSGFDRKAMREVIRLRKLEPADRSEQEELVDLYRRALGI